MCEKAKKLVFGNWKDNEADAEKAQSSKYASWGSSACDTSGQSRSLQYSSSVSASHFVAERRFEIRHGIRGQKPKLKVRSQSSSGPRSARGSSKSTSKRRSMSEGRGKFNLRSSSESSDSGSDSSSGSELDSKSGSSSDSESTTGSSSHGTDMGGKPRLQSAVCRIHETWQSANSSKSVKTYRKHFQSRSRSSSLPRAKRVCPSKPQRDLTYGSPEPKSPANRGRNSWKKSQSRSMSCSPIPKVSVNRSLTRSRSTHWNTWSQSKSLSPPTWKLPMDEGYNNDVHYRERHNITLTSWDGREHPEPVLSFERSGFNATILQQLEDQGFDAPTPIQAQTWSIAEEGRNIVMISGKGTGKTLGYLLPGIMNIDNQRGLKQRKKGPIVLILVNGRDAAVTVQREVLYYTNPLELRTYCLLGSSQWQLHAECDLLVASAGRLLQMLDNKKHVVELERCTYLVVDGIDRMIDVGLEGNICRLLCCLRKRAQLVVTSTSWSSNLKRMAKKFMGQYTAILVGQINDLGMQLQNIRQRVEVVNGLSKIERLMEELASIYDTSDNPGKVVIYVKRQKVVEELVDLIRKCVPCEGIHSGCTAQEREGIIRDFVSGAYNIIVATQMSSIYLDVPGIRYVINYDFPDTIEKYAQRLSRSGWLTSNSNCEVISFFTKANYRLVMDVVDFLKVCKQEIGPHLLQIAEEKEFGPRQRKRHRPPRYNRRQ
ncbi:putative ATP-dependent RNA helicase CG14443 [Drosophila sechellia]|uniref:RNA helicase n=1 Tax=Drosophila sechellia TaxID=7238 RepID=B4I090_DROSE|nr:putative ATP-dependent RNA helicase CG14443 [Drosophila sechellia]EDW52921.1 GM12505 [Drosophila sechellia]